MKPQYFNNELIFKCGVFPLLSPSSHIPLTFSELLSSNINSCHSFNLMHVTTIIVLILADYVCIIIMYVYSDI